MLFESLRASLKGKLAPAYVMSGTDLFLINKSIELILTAASVDKMNVIRLEEDATQHEINMHLLNISMFGNSTAVLIRGINETRVFLKPIKDLKEAQKVDCDPMSEALVIRMIMQNKEFNQETAAKLARMCENNFSSVSNEMQKLLAYGSLDNIEGIVTKTEKYQTYELSNALIKKDAVKSERILDTLNASGVDDYAVFGGLVSFARRLFYCKASPLSDAELSKVLGCNPYAVTATRRDSRNVTMALACKIYETALELEYKIKSGKILTSRATVLLAGAML